VALLDQRLQPLLELRAVYRADSGVNEVACARRLYRAKTPFMAVTWDFEDRLKLLGNTDDRVRSKRLVIALS
jgi:hypothetical protein